MSLESLYGQFSSQVVVIYNRRAVIRLATVGGGEGFRKLFDDLPFVGNVFELFAELSDDLLLKSSKTNSCFKFLFFCTNLPFTISMFKSSPLEC